MLIGTAGHIDHGKTSLVKALTGIDADRLPEEKARGITIDLGYAFSPDGRLAFIDVPGHEKLVHNMLAGAIGIEFALLVVAVDDGPMPQTLEHLQILDLLGVTRALVALTKTDTVDMDRLMQVTSQVRALLAGTTLRDAEVIATSVRSGVGIERVRAALLAAAETPGMPERHGEFRLAVDRCFTVAGAGTVVTGTVYAGRVTVGDSVTLTPPGIALRVRGLHAQNREAGEAAPGQRCALNLTGEGFSRDAASRGQWIVAPALHQPTACLDVRLRVLPSEGQALQHWSRVHLHLASAHVTGHVALLEADELLPGDAGLAQLVLDRPLGALFGDRFILRDASAHRTLGGGVVLTPFGRARGRRGAPYLVRLRALDTPDDAAALSALIACTPDGISLRAFRRARNLRECAEAGLLAGLPPTRVVPAGGDRVMFDQRQWIALHTELLSVLASAHAREPDMQGVSRERLRRMLARDIAGACFDVLLGELVAHGMLAQTGPWLHLPAHKTRLAPEEARVWALIRPMLGEQPAKPPRVRDLARSLGLAEPLVRRVLRGAARIGEAFHVAQDHFYRQDAVHQLAQTVARIVMTHGSVSAADFRDAIGTGRKLAIHILEFFDRVGFTRRVKNAHVLRNGALFGAGGDSLPASEANGRETSPGGAAGLQIR